MRAEYEKPDREDSSKPNRASIAFVWELGNKKILLLGDATSGVVIEGIMAYKKKNQIPLETKSILMLSKFLIMEVMSIYQRNF